MFRGLIVGAILSCVAVASAQQHYAQQTVPVRAGILIIDSYQSSGYQANGAPHAWYNFDANKGVKPIGWNVYNPFHTSQATATDVARWSAFGANPPGAGDQTTKRDASYWEVFLNNISEDQLHSYDILLLPIHGHLALNSLERERLRRFMDRGGILWVDADANSNFSNTGGPTDDIVSNLPLPFRFSGGAPVFANPAYAEPLLNSPFPLNLSDLTNMRGSTGQGFQVVQDADLGSVLGIEESIKWDSYRLQQLMGDNNSASIAMGQVGDGFEIVTGAAVATALNHVPGSVNTDYHGLTPTFDASSNAAAKLVVNMVSLAADNAQQGRGARKSGSSPVDIGAPLLTDFSDTLTNPGGYNPEGKGGYKQPVVYKNLLVITTSDRIFVYDVDPKEDLDGDGNADDGIKTNDFSSGKSYDLIWASQTLSGPISAPTCIYVPNAASGHRDQIWVTTQGDHLLGFSAFHFDGNSPNPPLDAVTPDYDLTAPTESGGAVSYPSGLVQSGPYPPTYHDGLLFVADDTDASSGRIWIANPETGSNLHSNSAEAPAGWAASGSGVYGDVTGPPTVGYVSIFDNSGGLDRVVYIPTRANSTGGPNATAGVTSLWLGAKGERPSSTVISGSVLNLATRASTQGLKVITPDPTDDAAMLALGVRVSVIEANGNPVSRSTLSQIFSGAQPTQGFGILTFSLNDPAALQTLLDNGASVRVDYSINWGTGDVPVTSQILRGQMFLPDDPNDNDPATARRILNHITLGPDGTMYMVTSSQDSSSQSSAGGAYFAIREEGRGNFRVLTRWDLFDQHTFTLNQADPITYATTLANNDPVTQLVPYVGGKPLLHPTFVSSPVVANDVVYVTAQALILASDPPDPPVYVPNTILLAFDATPPVIELNTTDIGNDFTILQPDILRSGNASEPATFSVLQANQYVVEQSGSQGRGVIRIDNLSSTNRGAVLNCLSTSQPVILRRSGAPDALLEPNNTGSRWNPLLWYTVFTGAGNTDSNKIGEIGPVFVSGNTVFVPTTSALQSLVTNSTYTPGATNALLYGLKALIPPNDPYLVSDTARSRPWLNQLVQVSPADPSQPLSTSNITSNPDIVSPQTVGVSTYDDWRTRILQSSMGDSTTAYGVVGAYGKLFSWSDKGLWAFSKADFVVADEGRIAEFDGAGNPVWSSDQSFSTGTQDNGAAANLHRLVRPTRAYPIDARHFVVADPASNRVSVISKSGRETRSLESFILDATYRPDGLDPNEPTTFSLPSDVAYYTEVVLAANNKLSNPQAAEYWEHYLVADAGNRRLVDVVDRFSYDTATQQVGSAVSNGTGVLYWHSPDAVSGKKFSYTSVVRGYLNNDTTGTPYVIAGVGNPRPPLGAGSDVGTTPTPQGTGGIVIFAGNAAPQLLSTITVGATIPANELYLEGSSDLNGTFTQPGVTWTTKYLNDVNSVTLQTVNGQLAIMLTDATGVYEVSLAGQVDWMLPRTIPISQGVAAPVYSVMRRTLADAPNKSNPADFRPTYAKRLSSGDVLITNGYVGRTRKAATDPVSEFNGEVIEIDGGIGPTATPYSYNPANKNLGFSSLSIKATLPPVTGTRGIVIPVFADRR